MTSTAAQACMVAEDWAEKTSAKADINKDGKIDFAEFKSMHSWSDEQEHIAKNNWQSQLEFWKRTDNFLSIEQFLGGFRPKCAR